MVIGLVFIEMKEVVVTAGAEAFCVEGHFSFASLAFLDLGFPIELLVTCVAEALGVMFFLFRAIATFFYHHRLFLFRKKKFPGSKKTTFPKLRFDLPIFK